MKQNKDANTNRTQNKLREPTDLIKTTWKAKMN